MSDSDSTFHIAGPLFFIGRQHSLAAGETVPFVEALALSNLELDELFHMDAGEEDDEDDEEELIAFTDEDLAARFVTEFNAAYLTDWQPFAFPDRTDMLRFLNGRMNEGGCVFARIDPAPRYVMRVLMMNLVEQLRAAIGNGE